MVKKYWSLMTIGNNRLLVIETDKPESEVRTDIWKKKAMTIQTYFKI